VIALALALALATPPPAYVALGDSTGVGLGARRGGYPKRLAAVLAGAGRPVRLVNPCVLGALGGPVGEGPVRLPDVGAVR
jgi:lysophospholipase L1-like esterase